LMRLLGACAPKTYAGTILGNPFKATDDAIAPLTAVWIKLRRETSLLLFFAIVPLLRFQVQSLRLLFRFQRQLGSPKAVSFGHRGFHPIKEV
jgi:hypothetical protein